MQIKITNFPMMTGRHCESAVTAFSGQLILTPVEDRDVQDLVRSQSELAASTISATLQFDPGLLTQLARVPGQVIDTGDFVYAVCELLSFASRRAVGFIQEPEWWEGSQPVFRGTNERRGPVETPDELAKLLKRAVPIMHDPAFGGKTKAIRALRWFQGWREGAGIDLQFVRLWIATEMLASNFWKHHPGGFPLDLWRKVPRNKKKQGPGKLDFVLWYIGQHTFTAPLMLGAMYNARNAIVHGDPEFAEAKMSVWFGDLVTRRRQDLEPHFPPDTKLPHRDDYGCCVFEGAEMLSRTLEKVFLHLFGCTDFYFYGTAPYFTTVGP